MQIHISADKKHVTWECKNNFIFGKKKLIEKTFEYPVLDAVYCDTEEIFIITSYQEVSDNKNVLVFGLDGEQKGFLPLPFHDVEIRSFYSVDVNGDGTLTFYIDTEGKNFDSDIRVRYCPKRKIWFEINRNK